MREFFVAFRSRSEAARYSEALKANNVPCKLVNTPASASVGCGLSVKMLTSHIREAQILLSRGNYNSVIGAFYLDGHGGSVKI